MSSFLGKFEGGAFIPEAPYTWSEYIKGLVGVRVVLAIEKWRERRSNRQNSRYWVAVLPVVAEVLTLELPPGEMPVSKDEAHEKCKEHFLGFRMTSLGKIPKSTKNLNTEQFNAYTNRIEEWLVTKYGSVVPERGEEL